MQVIKCISVHRKKPFWHSRFLNNNLWLWKNTTEMLCALKKSKHQRMGSTVCMVYVLIQTSADSMSCNALNCMHGCSCEHGNMHATSGYVPELRGTLCNRAAWPQRRASATGLALLPLILARPQGINWQLLWQMRNRFDHKQALQAAHIFWCWTSQC